VINPLARATQPEKQSHTAAGSTVRPIQIRTAPAAISDVGNSASPRASSTNSETRHRIERCAQNPIGVCLGPRDLHNEDGNRQAAENRRPPKTTRGVSAAARASVNASTL
jgi:hypothetical protein